MVCLFGDLEQENVNNTRRGTRSIGFETATLICQESIATLQTERTIHIRYCPAVGCITDIHIGTTVDSQELPVFLECYGQAVIASIANVYGPSATVIDLNLTVLYGYNISTNNTTAVSVRYGIVFAVGVRYKWYKNTVICVDANYGAFCSI